MPNHVCSNIGISLTPWLILATTAQSKTWMNECVLVLFWMMTLEIDKDGTSDFLCIISREMRIAMNIIKGYAIPPGYIFSSFPISIFLFVSLSTFQYTCAKNMLWLRNFRYNVEACLMCHLRSNWAWCGLKPDEQASRTGKALASWDPE